MAMINPFRALRRITSARPDLKGQRDAPCSREPLRTIPLTDRPHGARLVTSATSALVLGVGPITDLALLLDQVELAQPACYLLVYYGSEGGRPQIRVGETLDVTMRLRTHCRRPPQPIEDIVVIGSPHVDFGRDAVTALQYALYYLALGAGRYEVIGAAPIRSPLQSSQPGTVARWLADLRPMVVSAGILALEQRGDVLQATLARARLASHRVAVAAGMAPARPEEAAGEEALEEAGPGEGGVDEANAVDGNPIDLGLVDPVEIALLHGFSTDIPRGLAAAPTASEYTLAWSDGSASALCSGDWCILKAGSSVRGMDRSGIQIGLTRKRHRLITAGILRPRGDGDVLEVVRDVALPSLTNAARVVTGSNMPGRCWTPV